ncbi:recombinase family protein [Nonomuraea sp. B19D2]|uniref:recombinase family protein n=1 Tax=Nonomuraea sp. B19D2 TaxID=3159561 RepID=UPI0032DB8520
MTGAIRNTWARERNPRRLRPLLHRRTRRHHPDRAAPGALGVPEDRIYIDRGFSGTTRRNRAGLEQALAAVWDGTVFTVTKFDRFARNMAEANETLTGLSGRGVLFGLSASVYDWNDRIPPDRDDQTGSRQPRSSRFKNGPHIPMRGSVEGEAGEGRQPSGQYSIHAANLSNINYG